MNAKAEQLILLVKDNPVLYDVTNADYPKIKLKDEKWNNIAETLNIESGRKAKKQWTKLRDCHRDALRRQEKKIRGSRSKNVQIKPWIFQQQMEFLLPFMTSPGTCLNDNEILILSDDDDDEEVEGEEVEEEQKEEVVKKEDEESCYTEIEMPVMVIETEDTINQYYNITSVSPKKSNKTTKPKPQKCNKTTNPKPQKCYDTTNLPPKRCYNTIKFTPKQNYNTTNPPPKKCQNITDSPPKKPKLIFDKELIINEINVGSMVSDNRSQTEPESDLKQNKDALRQFFDSMYNLTKAMPPKFQMQIRRKLFEAVTEAEEEIYMNPIIPSLSSSSSS